MDVLESCSIASEASQSPASGDESGLGHSPVAHFLKTILLLILGLFSAPALASDWAPIKKQDGVQIYSRFAPGSEYREFRGQVEVRAKPDQVVRVLQNLTGVPEWHYSTERVEVLRSLGMTDALVHIFISPPWPASKRDVICKVSLQLDEENDLIRITLEDQPDELPPQQGFERVRKLEAEWIIREASDTTSLIEYRTHTEPGGSMPRWLFNNVAMDVPLFTLLNLRRLFAKQARAAD